MSEYKVSRRYAISLLESAVEKKNLDSVSKDVELIVSTLDANRQVGHVLSSPVIKPHVKLAIIDEIFKARVTAETIEFLHFLVDKNREDLLENILRLFLELRDEKMGIVNVEIKSAVQLNDAQVEELKSKFEKYLSKKVRFNFLIDDNMLGGFVAKVGDTVFDASLRHQLELLKKQFLKGGASLN